MIQIDEKSLLVRTDTDSKLEELEKKLGVEGFTLNYWTPPDNRVCLVEVLRFRLPNLYQAAFGGIEELCVQVRLAQPDGRIFSNVLTPRSATGPSLKNLAIGSDDCLGVPIEAVLRIFRKPERQQVALAFFPSEEKLESFQKNLRRLRLKLPLLGRIAFADLPKSCQALDSGEFILGLSHWGASDWLQTFFDLLGGLIVGKKGRLNVVEGEKNQREVFSRLRRAIAAEWKKIPVDASLQAKYLDILGAGA